MDGKDETVMDAAVGEDEESRVMMPCAVSDEGTRAFRVWVCVCC